MFDKNVFSPKWVTAIITDSSNRLHLVPIKHTLDDYFVVEINKSLYVFKIDGRHIKQYRKNYAKTYSVIFYDTSHYNPISSETKELELVLEKNSLPKVNSTLADIFKVLGSREKKDFEKHDIQELVKDLSDLKNDKKKQSKILKEGYDYDDTLANVINYLNSLNIDEIVTPLKGVSNFIQDDLLSTDPAFMGTVISTYQRTDIQHKKITNTPSLGGRPTMKIIIFSALIMLGIFAGYIMYEEGYFTTSNPFNDMLPDTLTKNLPFDVTDDESVRDKYSTPSSLVSAIDTGEIDYDDLSPEVKAMVDSLG